MKIIKNLILKINYFINKIIIIYKNIIKKFKINNKNLKLNIKININIKIKYKN